MIKVFVYHDNPKSVKEICETVEQYFCGVKHSFRIQGYYRMNEAAAYLEKNVSKTDILFFDFSNYNVAYKMADYVQKNNRDALWVHIGCIDSLLKTLYLRPSAFLAEADDKSKITEIISLLDRLHRKKAAKETFGFKYEGEHVRIAFDSIDFFESNAKKVVLHHSSSDRKYYFTAKLSEIENVVPSFFLRCHQSYLVNMNKISQFDAKNHTIVLNTGEEVCISKRMSAQAKEKYGEFVEMVSKGD